MSAKMRVTIDDADKVEGKVKLAAPEWQMAVNEVFW
jgi:hypothetical protein